jgi:hypothetical protein
MARYDLDKDQRLSYSDYLEMITPFENEYVNLLNSRQAKNANMEHTYYEVFIFIFLKCVSYIHH